MPSKDDNDVCLRKVVPCVSRGMNDSLTKSFTRVEVEDAISQMAPLKSPRPNGFRGLYL